MAAPRLLKYNRDECIGCLKLGQATVDMALMRGRTRWCKLQGDNDQAAHVGVLYFRMLLRQPREFRFRSAKVELSFIAENEGPVVLSSLPQCVGGTPTQRNITTAVELNPQIQAGGNGASLGSVNRAEQYDSEDCWILTTHKERGSEGDYTSVVVRWEDTEDGNSVPLNRDFNTATVLYLACQPQSFSINTRIEGKLRSRVQDFRFNKLYKLKPRGTSKPLMPDITRAVELLKDDFEQMLVAGIHEENMKLGRCTYSDVNKS